MTSIEQNTRANLVPVKDMNPMIRNFDCEVIVLQKESEPTRTREGDLISRFVVADRTASIVLSVWGDQGADIRSGDILRITGVDNKVRMGRLYLSTPRNCKIRRVGQDTFPFVEKPNMSDIDYPQNSYNNNMNNNTSNSNTWNKNQQQQTQQNRIPANNNNNSNNNNRVIRGYQNNNNASDMNHPYRNRPQHQRGGFHNSNNRGRGRGNFNNNSGNRYHRDLDNPV